MLNNVLIGLETNIGSREKQQDAAIAVTNDLDENTKSRALAVLCDGMGGMQGGEKASNLCVDTIYEDYSNMEKIPDITQFLFDEIDGLDEQVSNMCDENGDSLKAGTTLVAVVIEDDKLYWAGVGDSRLYIVRNNEIMQVTKDHNYMMELMELVEQNKLSMEEALSNSEREALISYVGIGGIKYIDYNKRPFILEEGDLLVMCSDGLYRNLENEYIKQIVMASDEDMSVAAKCLVDEVLKQGNKHQDNLTVITIKYQ